MNKKNIRKILAAVLALFIVFPVLSVPSAADSGMPEIVCAPQNIRWQAGTDASYTCFCWGDEYCEYYNYEWFLEYEGKDYSLTYLSFDYPWIGFCNFEDLSKSPVNGPTVTLPGIQKGISGAHIYCVVTNPSDPSLTVTSPKAVIMVGDAWMRQPPREIAVPAGVYCYPGDEVILNCEATHYDPLDPEFRYAWYESPDGTLESIRLIEDAHGNSFETSSYKPDTSHVGTRYYVCMVENPGENANISYSSVISVEVREEYQQPQIVGIELISKPNRLSYEIGETLDLTGLTVRVWSSEGFRDMYDGAGVDVSPMVVEGAGKNDITVSYEGHVVSFSVTGSEPEGSPFDTPYFGAILTENPQNYRWNAGEDACYQAGVEIDTEGIELYPDWYLIFEGVEYKISPVDFSQPWTKYVDPESGPFGVGPIDMSYFLGGIRPGLDGAEIFARFETPDCPLETAHAIIMVSEEKIYTHPTISVPAGLVLEAGETVFCQASGNSGNVSEIRDFIFYQWYRSDDGTLRGIHAIEGATDSEYMPRETGVYFCAVIDGEPDDPMRNISYSSVIPIVVNGSFPEESEADSEPESSLQPDSEPESASPEESLTESETSQPGAEESENGSSSTGLTGGQIALLGGAAVLIAALIFCLALLLKRRK